MMMLEKELELAEGAEGAEGGEVVNTVPVSESVASPDTSPDIEFSVREPGVLEDYLRGLVAAALADDTPGQRAFHNMTIRFTCPARATATLALEELAGLMTRAGDTLRGELAAAAASRRAREDEDQKHRQTGSVQPLAYRNRRPTPSAPQPTSTAAARTPSHTMELSDAFAKARQPGGQHFGPREGSGPRGGAKGK